MEQALKADSHRNKQNRRTAKALFAQIKADGYESGYSRVTDFIREWRGREGRAPHAFVPLKFELGEAFQFDWSEEGLVVGGIYRRMQVSHLKLCASRAFWLAAYPSQGHEMLFDAHTRSFAALGGIPRRGIYDNMKTAVEKNVQDSRRRIWLDAQNRKFSTFTDLNAWLGERCRGLWSELPHPEYKGFSVAEMLEQERAEMMPMPLHSMATWRSLRGHPRRAWSVSSAIVIRCRVNWPDSGSVLGSIQTGSVWCRKTPSLLIMID